MNDIVERLLKEIDWSRGEIERLKKRLLAEQFRAAVAEWAVAGVVSERVQIRQTVTSQELRGTPDPLDIARYAGRYAGAALLERSRLAFKDHAQLYELMKQRDPMLGPPKLADELPPIDTWPRPF